MHYAKTYNILHIITYHYFLIWQNNFLTIGNKKLPFSAEAKIRVWRTVTDTLISCKGKGFKSYNLGAYTSYKEIGESEIKSFSREIYNDKGCIWTRVTNDVIQNLDAQYIDIQFFGDTLFSFVSPHSCFHYDTVMRINPVTLAEETVYLIDSITTTQFYIGTITRHDLTEAISSGFGLNKGGPNFIIENVSFAVFNKDCDGFTINYSTPKYQEIALNKVENIPSGSIVVITNLVIGSSNNNRKFKGYDNIMAAMKILD